MVLSGYPKLEYPTDSDIITYYKNMTYYAMNPLAILMI